jgi:hypothetical protein
MAGWPAGHMVSTLFFTRIKYEFGKGLVLCPWCPFFFYSTVLHIYIYIIIICVELSQAFFYK